MNIELKLRELIRECVIEVFENEGYKSKYPVNNEEGVQIKNSVNEQVKTENKKEDS